MLLRCGDCEMELQRGDIPPLHLTFLDPPFNQAKSYALHDDDMNQEDYWAWMQRLCQLIRARSADGAALYFMQREKNAEFVLRCLRETGWTLQNLIIWKKMTSAVPSTIRYGKQFQIIAFATKGDRPRVFHRLRIDPPLLPGYKHERERGMFVTDVWDDIRELTAGYFAGDEPLRDEAGERAHKQQTSLALLTRLILSSTNPDDVVCDPFAGTGTTLVAARQLRRHSIGVEIDPANVALIEQRLADVRPADDIYKRYFALYRHTEYLEQIWGLPSTTNPSPEVKDETPPYAYNLPLF